MKLTKVTITGIDDTITPRDLDDLTDKYQFVEFGILCSSSREGLEPRYPSREQVRKLLAASYCSKFAAHLCGQFSRDAVGGAFIWAIDRHCVFDRVKRIQFNGTVSGPVIDRLALYDKHFPNIQYILQSQNFAETHGLARSCGNYLPAFLFDASGGAGIKLDQFEAPPLESDTLLFGYAGGFGPDNLQSVLEAITAIPSDQPFWVDMESKVRTNDHLDLAKVNRCLEIASSFIR